MRATVFSTVLAGAALVLASGAEAQPQGVSVPIGQAKPGEVRLLVSGGMRAVMEQVRADAAKAIGRPLVIQYAVSTVLQQVIQSGQPFEVAIITPEVIDQEIARGRFLAGSRLVLASTPVGVAQRGGALRDISTPEALKAALLGAKTVRFGLIGTTIPTVNKAIDTLGIRDQVMAKHGPAPLPEAPGGALGPGEYDIQFTLASELLTPMPGYVFLGVAPASLNVPAVMVSGIGATGDVKAAQALIDFLRSPPVVAAEVAAHMIPGG